MTKKIIAGIGAVVFLAALFIGYRITRGPKASPSATAVFSQGGLDISVAYHRPFKKGRVLFGDKAAGALVPHGKYWRLGANNATEITFNKNVLLAGKPVNAGSYRMYAMPNASAWKIVLNSQLGKWGAWEADHDKDVLTVEVPVEVAPTPVEQFTINITGDATAAKIELAWDNVLVRVPVAAN